MRTAECAQRHTGDEMGGYPSALGVLSPSVIPCPPATAEQEPADLGAIPDEQCLLQALREGDEAAFVLLVDRFRASLLRVASTYVANRAVAEEVVQEAWMGVLEGLDRFEGRSTLKVWIFRILTNCAITRAQREAHSAPFSALSDFAVGPSEAAVEPDRFLPPEDPRWQGLWISYPSSSDHLPEERLLAQETRAYLTQAIAALPLAQRRVIMLRGVEGWSADEVCRLLGITRSHQAVLLHRARLRVRRALEQYLDDE
jgi:RNA polymerase sigma-70 factor (ECF subfamily)